jgi:hypothetical protein
MDGAEKGTGLVGIISNCENRRKERIPEREQENCNLTFRPPEDGAPSTAFLIVGRS